MHITPDDARLSWPGAVSLQRTDEWVMPWRAPYEEIELFPPLDLQGRLAAAAGVRLAFRSDTRTLRGSVAADAEMLKLDLCCDGEFIGSRLMAGKDGFRFDGLPIGEKTIELWLPQLGMFRLCGLELDDGASLSAWEDARPRWIAYGSSITHCVEAESPTQTWPAIVARRAGLNLMCLGVGGHCHLDPMIARVIRGLPADFISLCVGINVYGACSLSPRTYCPAVIGFIKIVREGHPNAPIAVTSPIVSPSRETTRNAVGLTLQAIRDETDDAVARLQAAGDDNIHYVNGLDIMGAESVHLLPDGLHPNAEGYKRMGKQFLERVARPLFKQRADSGD